MPIRRLKVLRRLWNDLRICLNEDKEKGMIRKMSFFFFIILTTYTPIGIIKYTYGGIMCRDPSRNLKTWILKESIWV